jgi:hypothetical protein
MNYLVIDSAFSFYRFEESPPTICIIQSKHYLKPPLTEVCMYLSSCNKIKKKQKTCTNRPPKYCAKVRVCSEPAVNTNPNCHRLIHLK